MHLLQFNHAKIIVKLYYITLLEIIYFKIDWLSKMIKWLKTCTREYILWKFREENETESFWSCTIGIKLCSSFYCG